MALASPASARKNASPESPGLRRAIAAAEVLAGRDDPALAAQAMEDVASHPDFMRLDPQRRAALQLQGTRLAIAAGDHARAYRLARAVVDSDPTDPDGWFLLGQLAANEQRYAEAAGAFTRLATDLPGALRHVPMPILNQTILHLGLDAPARDFLEALHAAGWTVDGIPAEHAWARLALLRSAQGDQAGARELVDGIGSPEVIVWMRSDRRFDALLDRDAPRFEPVRAAGAWVERLAALAAEAPASLPLQRELVHGLLVAGRPDDALVLAARALAAPERFDDASDLAWMHNLRAIAFRRLGRTADAVQELTLASAMEESGQPNVSQALNLGTLFADLERPADALATVARVEGMSGYGLLVQSTTRMRAELQLGRAAEAGAWLERIRDGREDGPLILLQALLVNGRMDEAAALLRTQLDDSDDRIAALEWCQEFLASEPLPGRRPVVEARRQLLAREDVRAAVDAVGRIEHTGIHGSPGID